MWVGWNSTLSEDKSPTNKIFYLPQINQSPTSVAVVAETNGLKKLLKRIENKKFA